MNALIASLVPLVAGPLIVKALMHRPHAARALDAFVMMAVGGLVLLNILPAAVTHGGFVAVGAFVLGLFVPAATARWLGGQLTVKNSAILMAALLALAIHATLDGIALSQHSSDALSLAVVLHRLPVGIAIWWLVRPRYGVRLAIVTVAIIVVASLLGFAMSGLLLGHGWYAFQALVAGALVHVVLGHSEHSEGGSLPSAAGGLVGLVVVVGVSWAHPVESHSYSYSALSFGDTFLTLALEIAPAMLLAYLVAGLLRMALRDPVSNWRRLAWEIPAIICSCAVADVFRGMVRRGVPRSFAVASLVAAPEASVATVVISFQLFGARLTVLRITSALVLAITVGVIVGVLIRRTPIGTSSYGAASTAAPAQPRRSFADAFGETADHTMPWLVVGLVIAALVEPLVEPAKLAAVAPHLQVPAMALMAVPIYVCAIGSTPLIAVLLDKGLVPGAALAFLLVGAVTNLATLTALRERFGFRIALLFAGIGGLAALELGYVAMTLLPERLPVSVHTIAEEGHNWIEVSSLALLAGVLGWSFIRRGVHGFVKHLLGLHGHQH